MTINIKVDSEGIRYIETDKGIFEPINCINGTHLLRKYTEMVQIEEFSYQSMRYENKDIESTDDTYYYCIECMDDTKYYIKDESELMELVIQ